MRCYRPNGADIAIHRGCMFGKDIHLRQAANNGALINSHPLSSCLGGILTLSIQVPLMNDYLEPKAPQSAAFGTHSG